ncbi:L-seryl-tRNA(Sec) selenium transferase [Virgibacillus flavescens]|uniref:L-seryl-tRNA(Sec) selenium transferase n=1 Tax=Virgibacillus flavescens TaxID=1611422 RepID=UPI003D346899
MSERKDTEAGKMRQLLREMPAIHEIQNTERYRKLRSSERISDNLLRKLVRESTNYVRDKILNGDIESNQCTEQAFLQMILSDLEEKTQAFLKSRLTNLINGTGTVLHTNLGRSRLSEQAVNHVVEVAAGYSNLEFEIAEGKRGSRHDIVENLLKETTGAEAAMVVNNNAAAVFLILRALAKEKEVIVSRGQLVEIGGSFRISSIMEESGANLVEVGTTNKTHLFDYENAVNENTSMILKVHTSNFKTIGFTEAVGINDLVHIKNQNPHVIVYEDLGSGSLYDFQGIGIGDEPIVSGIIESGVDLVSFSGDKLLGGPQAGIIAGKKELIEKLKSHQLARVLRVDKMTLAALEETLKIYLSDEQTLDKLPTIRDIKKKVEVIRAQAESFRDQIIDLSYEISVEDGISQVGGGTMPDVELPTSVAAISHNRFTAEELAANLRKGTPPIITRVRDNKVVVDFRTITDEEMALVIERFRYIG